MWYCTRIQCAIDPEGNACSFFKPTKGHTTTNKALEIHFNCQNCKLVGVIS